MTGIATTLPAATTDEYTLHSCREIKESATRLACYDKLADRDASGTNGTASTLISSITSSPTLPSPTAQATETSSTPNPTTLSPEDFFGRDARQSEQLVLRISGTKRINQIGTHVVSISDGPGGKLVLGMENGQIWSQIDSTKLQVRIGDEVQIRRALFDSYLLANVAGGPAIRVRRSK